LRKHWQLEPGITFLNHGSFGACPAPILAEQARLRAQMEANPMRFMVREQEALLDGALQALGAFLGAAPADLAFVPNATAGVNAVLRSLQFKPGDEILTTDHLYPACRNTLDYVAARTGARVVVARIPFPVTKIREPILDAAGPRTRLAVLDRESSPTALVFPVEGRSALAARGIDTLVDAPRPGRCHSIDALGAAAYVGNCHKWLCAQGGRLPPRSPGPPVGAGAGFNIAWRYFGAHRQEPLPAAIRLDRDDGPDSRALRARGAALHGRLAAGGLARRDAREPRAGVAGARPALQVTGRRAARAG
jgi:hypothetical protein